MGTKVCDLNNMHTVEFVYTGSPKYLQEIPWVDQQCPILYCAVIFWTNTDNLIMPGELIKWLATAQTCTGLYQILMNEAYTRMHCYFNKLYSFKMSHTLQYSTCTSTVHVVQYVAVFSELHWVNSFCIYCILYCCSCQVPYYSSPVFMGYLWLGGMCIQ